MARIETYPEDSNVTINDIILGTDGDDANKTKNFSVSALTQFLNDIQLNAIPKIVTNYVSTSETIDEKLAEINLTVTAGESPVFLVFLKDQVDSETSEVITVKYVYLFTEGNGTYNPVSDTVSLSDLLLVEFGNPTQSDINGLENTTIIDLGVVTGGDFVAEINGTVPSFDLSDSNETYFFSYQDGNLFYLQKFIGTNGFYGLNDDTAVTQDFISFSDNIPDDDNVKAKFVEVTLGSATFASEALEIDDVVRVVNLLDPNVTIADNELFLVYSDTLENTAKTIYRTVYVINTGKGTYGDGATQIASSNVLKIRGEKIEERLGDFTNNINYADQPYVDSAVALRLALTGGTMTGNIVMGANKVTSTATPSADEDLANKAYADSLNRFRGHYSDSATIIALSSNTAGDYATLSNGSADQLWVYQNSAWNLISAKPYYVEINSNTTLTNDYHNATINVGTGNIDLTFPDTLIDGFEVNIRNFSGGLLNILATGTATVSVSSLFNGTLASAIGNGSDFVIDTTETNEYDKLRLGIYDYSDTQSAISLTADTWEELSNNGAGSNTYKNPIFGVADVYDVATDRFDFSGLNIGDTVSIRVDLTVTSSANQVIDCEIVLGEGEAGEYNLPLTSSQYFKDAGTYSFSETENIYIGNDLTKDNPAYLRYRSSGNDSVNVNGYYIEVKAKVPQ